MPTTIAEAKKPTLWQTFLHQVGIASTGRVDSLFRKVVTTAPASFAGRIPIFMRRVRDIPEMVLISRPASPTGMDKYGLHTIRFDATGGFFWFGDYMEAGLPVLRDLRQVLANSLLYINEEDGKTTRVYQTDWLHNPPVQPIRVYTHTSPVIDMGTINRNVATMVHEDGTITNYVFRNNDCERILPENKYLSQKGMKVLSANIVTNDLQAGTLIGTNVLLNTIDSQNHQKFWHYSLQGTSTNMEYPVIGTPVLGSRHVTLLWYGYPHASPCEYSTILVTGEPTRISIFAVVTGYFQLVKFKSPSGALLDSYTFAEPTFDWDAGLGSHTYDGSLKLLRSTVEGLRVDTLNLVLSGTSSGGDGTFEIVSSSLEQEISGEQRCAYWSSPFPAGAGGYFSVGRNGTLTHSW